MVVTNLPGSSWTAQSFQSPTRRVSGCNSDHPGRWPPVIAFQSPTRRVSGCNRRADLGIRRGLPFSPLHVGSVVVTTAIQALLYDYFAFSPLHVGSVVVTLSGGVRGRKTEAFSPLHVGSVVVTYCLTAQVIVLKAFSPLHVGSVVVTPTPASFPSPDENLSVPYTSGQWL